VAAAFATSCGESESSNRAADAGAPGGGGSPSAEVGGAGAGGLSGAAGEPSSTLPELLSETGLYVDLTAGEALAPDVLEYRPRFELWSDGAEKRRFLRLPPGTQIDTADMDFWRFPPGTRAWKEFQRDGVRVETRLLQKISEQTWLMQAYAWNDDESDALAAPGGVADARGTDHDIPSRVMCGECHNNVPDRLLGVSALQLAQALPGLTLADLSAEGRLSDPPAGELELPGDEVAQAALGYLHANCGNCHNPRSGVYPTVELELWLAIDDLASVEATGTYLSTVGVELQGVPPGADVSETRIEPGSPQTSAVYQRMASRDALIQMPPLGTEAPDDDGLARVAAWIEALAP